MPCGHSAGGCSSETGETRNGENNLSAETTAVNQEHLVLGDLSNLDLSEVEDSIALPEKLYEMESKAEGTWTDEKIYEEFPKLIAAYGGPDEEALVTDEDIIVET